MGDEPNAVVTDSTDVVGCEIRKPDKPALCLSDFGFRLSRPAGAGRAAPFVTFAFFVIQAFRVWGFAPIRPLAHVGFATFAVGPKRPGS